MKRPVNVYREMLQEELSAFRPVASREEILDCLEKNRNEARSEVLQAGWPSDQRAARLIWAGIGFLAFGRLDRLEETLQTILAFPQSANYSACRYYVPAIERLLPLPSHLRLTDNPQGVLEWFRTHADQIQWDEELGKFVYAKSEVHLS